MAYKNPAAGTSRESRRGTTSLGVAIRNETGSQIAAGSLVYVSGWSETHQAWKVTLADADVAGAQADLIVRTALDNNTTGVGYSTGRITGANTNGATVGDPVYLHTTAGSWTLTAPSGSDDVNQIVGRVAVVSATVGEIEVFLQPTHLLATNELQARSVTWPKIALRTVSAKTSDYPIVAATDNGHVFTTVGASGTVTFSLPAATVGQEYIFRVGAAQELRIDPNGTETIALPSTGVAGAAGKYLVADADGETVHIICTKTGTWSVIGYTGTWTAEA